MVVLTGTRANTRGIIRYRETGHHQGETGHQQGETGRQYRGNWRSTGSNWASRGGTEHQQGETGHQLGGTGHQTGGKLGINRGKLGFCNETEFQEDVVGINSRNLESTGGTWNQQGELCINRGNSRHLYGELDIKQK